MVKKDRLYFHNKLISWRQRRCIRCQRFLSRWQKKYCSRCAPIMNSIKGKENYKKLEVKVRKSEYQKVYIKKPEVRVHRKQLLKEYYEKYKGRWK